MTPEEKQKEFDEVVRPVIKYLADRGNPYITIVIDSTNAEMMSSEMVYSTKEFLVD